MESEEFIMVKFEEVKKGYKKEQVDEYIGTVSSEYEILHGELKKTREEMEELEARKEELAKKVEYLNSEEYGSQQKVIASAILRAEVSGKQIVEDAKKEAVNIGEAAREELSALTREKKKAISEVKQLTEKLRILLREEQASADVYGTSTTSGQ